MHTNIHTNESYKDQNIEGGGREGGGWQGSHIVFLQHCKKIHETHE